MSITRLMDVVAAPTGRPPRRVDWPAVEAALGTALPGDYKALIEAYGPGTFSRFLDVFQPQDTNEYVDLVTQSSTCLAALRYLRDRGEPVPFRLDDPAELLPFARTDNGDVVYWRRGDGDPAGWTVAVNAARDSRWFEYDGDATGFLAAVLSHEVSVPMFPASFDRQPPTFAADD